MKECQWHADARAATERYFVVSLGSGNTETLASSTQAHSDEQYAALLADAGFENVARYPSLTGEVARTDDGLFVFVARRGG